jgi:hypothetical protein
VVSELLGSDDVLLPKSQPGRDGWPTMPREAAIDDDVGPA